MPGCSETGILCYLLALPVCGKALENKTNVINKSKYHLILLEKKEKVDNADYNVWEFSIFVE